MTAPVVRDGFLELDGRTARVMNELVGWRIADRNMSAREIARLRRLAQRTA